MPPEKLNTAHDTRPHRPHSRYAERRRSRRCVRRRDHSPSPSPASASGSSHAIWPPTAELNMRRRPGSPPKLPAPPPPSPDTRERPLAPKMRVSQELSVVSPTHGRSAAGSSIIVPYHAKLTASIAAPPAAVCAMRLRTVPRPARRNVRDRKSTRLNYSHANISYAVFCFNKDNTADANHAYG